MAPRAIPPTDSAIVIRFGGGVHSAAAEDEINEREASSGVNFALDPETRELSRRSPFDLIGTAPNAGQINGFACLLKNDGTVSMLVQAGTNVYELSAGHTFTLRGTVASGTKIRGPLTSNWPLAPEKVLITDLNLSDTIKTWDGTTFASATFVNENGSTLFGAFGAKYCIVDNERALFANILDVATKFPHLIVASARSNFLQITVANRPSSALSAADPFFLVQPDNRAINGIVSAFGIDAVSSNQGSIFQMSGSSAKDFAIASLYPRSGVAGDESFTYVGNDIVFGRLGRIESLTGVNEFGDVITNDYSLPIKDDIQNFSNWLIVYNQRFQRVYCHPIGQSRIWVLHKPLVPGHFAKQVGKAGLSPWVKWTTTHAVAFNPTAMMACLDPADGLEYTFFGDASGNVFKLEGSGLSGDAGTNTVVLDYLTPMYTIPMDAQVFDIEGWITHRRQSFDSTVTLKFEYNGEEVFDETVGPITLPAAATTPVYGGAFYYGQNIYYGASFRGRVTRKKFDATAQASSFQIRIQSDDVNALDIIEIGLRFRVAGT